MEANNAPLVIGGVTLQRSKVYLLGAGFALLFFLFSAFVIIYSPRSAAQLMTTPGIFSVNRNALALVFGVLFGGYSLVVWLLSKYLISRTVFRIAIGFVPLFIVALLVSPPFLSADLYGYVVRAAITNLHHVNPYVVAPAALGYTNILPWPYHVSVYGPLMTSITLGINTIVGNDITANIFIFRLVSAALFCGSAALVYFILKMRLPQFRYLGTILFAWNPYLLIETIHSAHNDAYVFFFILLCVYCCCRRWYVGSVIALTAGFLVKFNTVLLVPVVLLLIVLDNQSTRKKVLQLLLSGVAAAILVALLYLPYHNFSANLGNLGRAFIADDYLTVPKAAIIMIVTWLSGGGHIFTISNQVIRGGYLIVFAAAYGLAMLLKYRTVSHNFPLRFLWILLSATFLLGGKFNIWYIVWFVPLLFLSGTRWSRACILLFTAYGFSYYLLRGNVFFANLLLCVSAPIFYLVLHYRNWQFGQHRAAAIN